MTVHGKKLHIGMFATEEEAGRARDRYAIDHDLRLVLNYPEAVMV